MPLCPPHFPTNQSTLSGFIYLIVDVYAWKSVEAFLKRSKVKSCPLFSSQAQPFFFFLFLFWIAYSSPLNRILHPPNSGQPLVCNSKPFNTGHHAVLKHVALKKQLWLCRLHLVWSTQTKRLLIYFTCKKVIKGNF